MLLVPIAGDIMHSGVGSKCFPNITIAIDIIHSQLTGGPGAQAAMNTSVMPNGGI